MMRILVCDGSVTASLGGSVGGRAYVPAMRLLHTSDWHVGRSLHGTDLLAEQEAVLARLATVVRSENVDVVVVAGDVYDRAVPSADATAVLDRSIGRILAAGATVVMTPGNHDSARRLGTFSGLLSAAGLHVRADTGRLDDPVLVSDEHGEVAIYGVPYLEPEVARHELGLGRQTDGGARGHEAVLRAAMDRVRADLFLRPGARSVVLAHAFVGGAEPSESERDICVGGVDRVPEAVFDGVDYVALGHLHRPQSLTARMRYSGSPLPYSFGEAGHDKQAWLVDLDANGLADVRAVPLPAPRPLTVLTGTLADLLVDPEHAAVESHFVSVRLTDQERPTDPMRRLRDRFPWCVHLEWTGGQAAADGRSYQERLRGRDDLDVTEEFVRHVRGTDAGAGERELLRRALIAAVGAENDELVSGPAR
jgi:exonuclease SbcD